MEEAKKAGLANTITYNSTLSAIANSPQPELAVALRLLEEAKAAGLHDVISYHNTLDVIAKSLQPDVALALRLFAEIKNAGVTNAISYNTTLSVIAKSGQPDTISALRLLEEAKKARLADSFTYASTLAVIAKSSQPDAATALRLLVDAKKAGFANSVIYKNILDALAKSAQPDTEQAKVLIAEVIKQFKCGDLSIGKELDLHGLSYGIVYFGLKNRLQQAIKAKHSIPTLILVYGKGLHTQSGEEIHLVKQAVMRVVNELSTQGVVGQENKDNSGRFELSFHPVANQTNASNPHGVFAGRLNPNVKAFVPAAHQAKPTLP